MKKITLRNKLIPFIVMFFGSLTLGFGQTTLSAGDVVINGFNSDNPDQFSFVLLTDVTSSTSINFTDDGWQTSGSFRAVEGTITWTATADLVCGTEVIIENIGANLFSSTIGTAVSSINGFALAIDGDQILVYQGPDSAPTFIFGISFDSTGWSDATTANTSALPPGLTLGVDEVNLGETDNGVYDCSVLNDSSLILSAVANNANWTLSNTPITIGGCYYTCCASTVTWNGAWNPAAPSNTDAVVISANYSTSLNGSFEACSLSVDTGSILEILGTDHVLVVNDINVDGTIRMASEASLVQVNDLSTVTVGAAGDCILQKSTELLTAWYDYTYWSSPVSNETIGSVFGLVPSDRIFEYDASNFNDSNNDTFDDEGDDWSVASGNMIPGKGYAAVAENNPFPFPQTNTMSFNGQFNTGVITIPITMSPGPNPLNWNFLGNPYPSPINAISFVNDPANSGILGGTFYFWTHNSPPDEANPGNDVLNFSIDDYATYVVGTGGIAANSGGVVPTEFVATGQGFFVEGLSAGVATFNNAMRTDSGNTNFYRTSDKVWLNFTNNYGAFSQILIGFNEYATDDFDRLYDGKRLDTGSFVSFYSFIENQKFGIQSRSELKEEELIPLGFMTTIEGENQFSIAIDKIEGLLEDSEIYLIDYYLNKEHDLNVSDYTFTTTSGSFADRFALKLKSELTDVDTSFENELVVTQNENGGLNFTTTHQSIISNVKIFDLLGRLIYDEDFDDEITTARIHSVQLNNTILITNVTLANGDILAKKIIN